MSKYVICAGLSYIERNLGNKWYLYKLAQWAAVFICTENMFVIWLSINQNKKFYSCLYCRMYSKRQRSLNQIRRSAKVSTLQINQISGLINMLSPQIPGEKQERFFWRKFQRVHDRPHWSSKSLFIDTLGCEDGWDGWHYRARAPFLVLVITCKLLAILKHFRCQSIGLKFNEILKNEWKRKRTRNFLDYQQMQTFSNPPSEKSIQVMSCILTMKIINEKKDRKLWLVIAKKRSQPHKKGQMQ